MEDTQATATQLQTNMQLLRQRVEERKKLLIETLTYYRNNERVSIVNIVNLQTLPAFIEY